MTATDEIAGSKPAERTGEAPCRPPGPAGSLLEAALGYQRVLARDPANPKALLGMSLTALASRQFDSAVKMAEAAVAAAPAVGAAWVALGQALKAAGRLREAEQACMQALRLDGMDPLARLSMGELKIFAGRPQNAVRDFELALARQPLLLAAHLGLGNALASAGRMEDALARYERALALKPRSAEAHFAAGFALARLGRSAEAESRYRRAVALRPDFAAAWMNLGSLLREQARDVLAEAALRRAAALRPDLISGWVNLAVLERERRRPEKAEAYLRQAFLLNPSQVETLIAWCQFRAGERDLAGAWQWLRWALARSPNHEEARNMEGILLHNERRFDEAVAAFERAEALGSRGAASNRGNSLLDLGRMTEALRAHELAVARDPGHPGAEYNLALTQLRLGDWKRGWPGYEARWRFREVHRRPRQFAQPRWRGEPLGGPSGVGRRILLHAEQGLGDTIQFCRYAAMVAARGGVPVMEVQPAAEPLLRSLAIVRAGLGETAMLGARPGSRPGSGSRFEFECPLMSLPAVFGTTAETAPWPGAYLGADSSAAAGKRAQFPSLCAGPRIGLAWAGNPRYKSDHLRSTKFATLVPLLRAVEANWISLQKGEAVEQLAGIPAGLRVQDGSSRERDLSETAALVATLDLVVTTDTCVAHLAGAMGKPVWILLPHLADWRWMEKTETTPWYPTARLFRQPRAGDWTALLERVSAELRELANSASFGPVLRA